MKKKICKFCNTELTKDEIALGKKLFGRQTDKFMCLACIADDLSCSKDDLIIKIEEFKEDGCTLFE